MESMIGKLSIRRLRYYVTDQHHKQERIISPYMLMDNPPKELIEQFERAKNEWNKYVVLLCSNVKFEDYQ